MRERSWISLLLLCMGCSSAAMLEAKETGKSISDLEGKQPAHIRATVGGSVTLSCSFVYIGHINDLRLGKFHTRKDSTGRVSEAGNVKCSPHVSKEAHLHCKFSFNITNLHPDNETIYYCEVYIPRAEGLIKVTGTGTAVTLYSEVSSIGIQPPPQLVSGSESALTCEASGFYPGNVSVQWFHGETPVPPSDVSDIIAPTRDGTFSLHSSYRFRVNAPDDGVQCRCLVSHPIWTREGSASVMLDVGYGPSFVNVTSHSGPLKQDSLQLTVGSPLDLSCLADGNPRPEMWWLGGSRKAQHMGSTLIFFAVQEEDGGMYWCVVKNMYGEKNASITLLVSQSELSPSGLRVAVLCILGTVLMILVITVVCLLTKRMNRSQARTFSESSSEGTFSQQSPGTSPAPQIVDESQLIYTELEFTISSPNQKVMQEATESPIYSVVKRKDAGGHRGAERNCQENL